MAREEPPTKDPAFDVRDPFNWRLARAIRNSRARAGHRGLPRAGLYTWPSACIVMGLGANHWKRRYCWGYSSRVGPPGSSGQPKGMARTQTQTTPQATPAPSRASLGKAR